MCRGAVDSSISLKVILDTAVDARFDWMSDQSQAEDEMRDSSVLPKGKTFGDGYALSIFRYER